MKFFFILGSHADLSCKEILACLEKEKVQFTQEFSGQDFLLLNMPSANVDTVSKLFYELGGSVKMGRILTEDFIFEAPALLPHLLSESGKKLKFAISFYGQGQGFNKSLLKKTSLELKKLLKEKSISSRWVSSDSLSLSSVAVKKNQLLKDGNAEIVVLNLGGSLALGRTDAVQRFAMMSKFDYGRPYRSEKRGMLPPKLAKIMINLAQVKISDSLLDPFCGQGTVLQMAALMGYQNLVGSDADNKMIRNTEKNFEWLKENFKLQKYNLTLHNIPAEKISQKIKRSSIDALISEPFMGPALRREFKNTYLEKNSSELRRLYRRSFGEFSRILKKDAKVVFIFPRIKQYDTLETKELKRLGFELEEKFDYQREGQYLTRQITILRKIS